MSRDPYTQELIEHARAQGGDREAAAVADTMNPAEGPFDDKLQPADIGIKLEGEYAAALLEFERTARDLNAHQVAGPPLLERYRAALARLSAAAVK